MNSPAGARPISFSPILWYVIFDPRARNWWLRLIPLGRFKHVEAIGYVADLRCWVAYNVELTGTRISVLPAGPLADAYIESATAGTLTLAVSPRPGHGRWFRLGFWCVPAISHALGLGAWCFRPDGLLRACLQAGGRPMCGEPLLAHGHAARHGNVRNGTAQRRGRDYRAAAG